MKKLSLLIIPVVFVVFFSCGKDEDTPFTLLTERTWVSDSLLVNGQNAGNPGQLLENFNGEVNFKKDGTGNFGSYTGTWRFAQNETQIIITTTELPLPLTTVIEVLTRTDLKVNTAFPDPEIAGGTLIIRMTFKAK